MKQAKFGKRQEQRVAQALRSRGAKVISSPASRGAADLKAVFPTGTKWNIQVKSSRSAPRRPSSRDLGRLKQSAKKDNATPVIARVSPRKIEYESAAGRKLNPPKRKK